MKRSRRTAVAFVLASLVLCANAGAKIVMFEQPDFSSGFFPTAMNDKGEVTGVLGDGRTGAILGFVWQKDGGLKTFFVPAPITRTTVGAELVFPNGITEDGAITGSFGVQSLLYDGGFVRGADGSFKVFSLGWTTNAIGTNKKGWIVGSYALNQRDPYQPFLRDPSGAIMDFSVPHAKGGAAATVVNRSRTIAGVVNVNGGERAFFRPAHGTATLFGRTHYSVSVSGINNAGTVTGTFADSIQGRAVSAAFVRTVDGTITTFAGPKGATDINAYAINNSGTIVGTFVDASRKTHGFFRTAEGTFTPFDVKGSDGTDIRLINDKDAIAGKTWIDGHVYGFAGKP